MMPMFWLAFTLLAYLFSRWIYRRTGRYLLSPLILVPALLLALAVPLHTAYAEYSSNTHWLMLVLGPGDRRFRGADLAAAALVDAALVGVAAGHAGRQCGVDRHFVRPGQGAGARQFGDDVAGAALDHHAVCHAAGADLGGVPELTAVFVMFTGVFGAMLGGVLLKWLPLRSALARGALFGVGAHGAGVSRAHEVGGEEGSVAGLVMVLDRVAQSVRRAFVGVVALTWIQGVCMADSFSHQAGCQCNYAIACA